MVCCIPHSVTVTDLGYNWRFDILSEVFGHGRVWLMAGLGILVVEFGYDLGLQMVAEYLSVVSGHDLGFHLAVDIPLVVSGNGPEPLAADIGSLVEGFDRALGLPLVKMDIPEVDLEHDLESQLEKRVLLQ